MRGGSVANSRTQSHFGADTTLNRAANGGLGVECPANIGDLSRNCVDLPGVKW